LLGRRDAGRGQQDEERDLVGRDRRERADPGSLADPPEANPLGVQRAQHGQRVIDLKLEAPARRVAGRLALAAAVEGDDADPVLREQLVHVAQRWRLARALAGPVQRDERRRAGH
jgi:hypothetical protein